MNVEIKVPEWARWMAQDANGEWYFYGKKPICRGNDWGQSGGRFEAAYSGEASDDWDDSLHKVVWS